MAHSLTDIEINCRQGLRVADQLLRAADELRREFDELHTANEGVRASWTGASANRFAAKMSEAEEQVYAQVKDLYNLADAIKQTVAIYKQEQTDLFYREQNAKKGSSSGSSHSGGGHSTSGHSGGGHDF